MSIVGWCWFAWLVFLTIVSIRCIKQVFAMSQDWSIHSSSCTRPSEGDHAADHQDH
jgi:hypothetical protein